MPHYEFQETKLGSDTDLTVYPKRKVLAHNESAARKRLPKPRPGRTWHLVFTESERIDGVRIRIPAGPVPLKDPKGHTVGIATFDFQRGIMDGVIDPENPYGKDLLESIKIGSAGFAASIGPLMLPSIPREI